MKNLFLELQINKLVEKGVLNPIPDDQEGIDPIAIVLRLPSVALERYKVQDLLVSMVVAHKHLYASLEQIQPLSIDLYLTTSFPDERMCSYKMDVDAFKKWIVEEDLKQRNVKVLPFVYQDVLPGSIA